jgi:hypothetical protein
VSKAKNSLANHKCKNLSIGLPCNIFEKKTLIDVKSVEIVAKLGHLIEICRDIRHKV